MKFGVRLEEQAVSESLTQLSRTLVAVKGFGASTSCYFFASCSRLGLIGSRMVLLHVALLLAFVSFGTAEPFSAHDVRSILTRLGSLEQEFREFKASQALLW